jgi:1-acyl-sn-glycerol-3-phosphate acyltransferase
MWYELVTGAGLIYITLFRRYSFSGIENLPATGPVILAANHKSNLDPFYITAALKRKVHFLAKDELFHNPVLGWVMGRLGTVQVKRGESDRDAIAKALGILKQQEVLGIFVEGTRRKDITGVGDLKSGAAMLSHHAKTPIVPVGIIRRGRHVHVGFGEPIYIEKLVAQDEVLSRKAVYARINEALLNNLNVLLTQTPPRWTGLQATH